MNKFILFILFVFLASATTPARSATFKEFKKTVASENIDAICEIKKINLNSNNSADVNFTWMKNSYYKLREEIKTDDDDKIEIVSIEALKLFGDIKLDDNYINKSNGRIKENVLDDILKRDEFVRFKKKGTNEYSMIGEWYALNAKRMEEFLRKLFPKKNKESSEWFYEFMDSLTSTKGVLVCLFVVLVIGIILYLLFYKKGYAVETKNSLVVSDELEEALGKTAESWRDEASVSAEKGDLRDALRKLYLALIVFFYRHNVLTFSHSLTNWEHIRSVSKTSEYYTPFKVVTMLFEQSWYGMNPVSEEEYNEAKECVDKVLSLAGETSLNA